MTVGAQQLIPNGYGGSSGWQSPADPEAIFVVTWGCETFLLNKKGEGHLLLQKNNTPPHPAPDSWFGSEHLERLLKDVRKLGKAHQNP